MATVINNPPAGNNTASGDGGSGMGMVLGILLALIIFFLFIIFGWPAIRGNGGGTGTPNNSENVDDAGGGTTLNVPDEIDVNIQKK